LAAEPTKNAKWVSSSASISTGLPEDEDMLPLYHNLVC
jgi:hypothetical protein